jgi:preprotein translocase subunit Sec63
VVDHRQIDKARKTLDLQESATIPEIKRAYRRLSLKYHPDNCGEKDKKKCEKKFKEINSANQVLIEYCLSYRFPLKKARDVETSEDRHIKDHMKRFYDGWWGDLGNE